MAPLTVIITPVAWTSISFPEASKVPSSETFETIVTSLFSVAPAAITSPVCEDPS